MNVYRADFLWHAWMVHACLAELNGEASIDLATFRLEVRARNRYYRFYPRFHVRKDDQLVYVERPDRSMRGFAGWLPYFNKRWPIGTGKFTFKEFCLEQGLPMPRTWRSAAPEMRDFLIKHDQSSSGSAMRGPFAVYEPDNVQQVLPDGSYYEQFVRGQIVKAWYWEDRLATIEMWPMPTVTGDGKSTIRQIIQRSLRPQSYAPNWDNLAAIARYQGTTLETVLPQGQSQLAEFRYATSLSQAVFDDTPTLERYKDSPIQRELAKLGPTFWNGIPENMRPATLYSVDAIADDSDKLWLLEMNCNPVVTPEVYPLMFERLFGARATPATDGTAVEAPVPPPAAALPLPALLDQRARGLPASFVGGSGRWIS